MPKFDWDPPKALDNVRKHRISFRDAKMVWQGPYLTDEDDREDYGEVRYVTLGVLPGGGPVLHVTHTYIGDRIRIISARRATKRETEKYYENIG